MAQYQRDVSVNEKTYSPRYMKWLEFRDIFGISFEEFEAFCEARKKNQALTIKEFVERSRGNGNKI